MYVLKSHGLGDHWREIYVTYLKIPRVYGKTNSYISLFQDIGWRKEVLGIIAGKLNGRKGLKILDAGSGPGTMSDILCKTIKADIVLLDYSVPMLGIANKKYERIQGSFESMPFRAGIFDAVIMGFSFHSSIDMNGAIDEIARVSKRYLAIVGIGKSAGKVNKFLGEIYLAYLMPILAYLASPKHYKYFQKIERIYNYIPDNLVMHRIIKRRFSTIRFAEREFGTLFQFVGKKRR